MTSKELAENRLVSDVINGLNSRISEIVRYGNYADAITIANQKHAIAEDVIRELRRRWTIVERPRKQVTIRQDA